MVKTKEDTIPEKNVNPREKEEDEFTYHIYDKDNNLVATVDSEGNIEFAPEYLENINEIYLKSLELDKAEFELPEELGKDDLELSIEELETKKDINDIKKILNINEIDSYSTMKADQTSQFEKITNKQTIDPNTRVTQTETLADLIPELKEKGITEVGVVYSDGAKGQSGRFSFVGKDKEGKIQSIKSLENIEGTTTGQTITSINKEDGSIVEKEQVAGMVRLNNRGKTNGQEEMLSIKTGQYGIIEVDYVRADLSKDKDERYLSAPIETQNQRPTTRAVREIMDKSRNTEIDDELKKSDAEIERDGKTELRNMDDTASNDYLTPDDVIVLDNGEETTLRKEAAKAKISPEDFTKRYNEMGGKIPDEKIENIHEEIEEEFGTPDRTKR